MFDNTSTSHTRRLFSKALLCVCFSSPVLGCVCVPVITVYAVCSGPPLQSVILFRFWKTTVAVFEGSSALFLFVVETNQVDWHSQTASPFKKRGSPCSTTKASLSSCQFARPKLGAWLLTDASLAKCALQLHISCFKADWRRELTFITAGGTPADAIEASCFRVVPRRRRPCLIWELWLPCVCNRISDCFPPCVLYIHTVVVLVHLPLGVGEECFFF